MGIEERYEKLRSELRERDKADLTTLKAAVESLASDLRRFSEEFACQEDVAKLRNDLSNLERYRDKAAGAFWAAQVIWAIALGIAGLWIKFSH